MENRESFYMGKLYVLQYMFFLSVDNVSVSSLGTCHALFLESP